eukprot:2519430-Amphidinium_carterae.2
MKFKGKDSLQVLWLHASNLLAPAALAQTAGQALGAPSEVVCKTQQTEIFTSTIRSKPSTNLSRLVMEACLRHLQLSANAQCSMWGSSLNLG